MSKAAIHSPVIMTRYESPYIDCSPRRGANVYSSGAHSIFY
jgi:hypothetical protein